MGSLRLVVLKHMWDGIGPRSPPPNGDKSPSGAGNALNNYLSCYSAGVLLLDRGVYGLKVGGLVG